MADGKVGFSVVNIYGSIIVGAAALKVHAFKGQDVFNKTTGKYVNAPALGAGGLDSNHELTATEVPHASNGIGFEINVEALPLGLHDIVYLDNLTYKGGIRTRKEADGTIVIVPE